MRTRLLKPEFWADDVMADLPDGTRLTYMGLWCLADDAGWLALNVRQIGAELYRYRPARARERRVQADIDGLVKAGRLEPAECGLHARIPSLGKHRIKGGKQSEHIAKEHRERCGYADSRTGQVPVPDRSLSVSVSESGSVSGSLRNGVGTRGSGDQDRSDEYGERVRRKLAANLGVQP